MIESGFIKDFTNHYNEKTEKQFQQIRSQLAELIEGEAGESNALEDLKKLSDRLNQLFEQFNQQKKKDRKTLTQKISWLKEAGNLTEQLAKQHQETYSELLIQQLQYYTKCFYSMSKKIEAVLLARQNDKPSDKDFIKFLQLLEEYLKLAWEVFPEDVINLGLIGIEMEQNKNVIPRTYTERMLNETLEAYAQTAKKIVEKAEKIILDSKVAEALKQHLDKAIEQANSSIEADALRKFKKSLKLLPSTINLGSSNIISFKASILDLEISKEEQIKRNQKVIDLLDKWEMEDNQKDKLNSDEDIKNYQEIQESLQKNRSFFNSYNG